MKINALQWKTAIFFLFFFAPISATTPKIVASHLRDTLFLKKYQKSDLCYPPKLDGIHPHIMHDCHLLITGFIKQEVPNMLIPLPLYNVILDHLAGDLDQNRFDKVCFVNNDTGAFIAPIRKFKKDGIYRINSHASHFWANSSWLHYDHRLACKAFKPPYGRSGYNKYGYDSNGYDYHGYNIYGYDENGYDEWGYDQEGYDREGYNEGGWDRDGDHKDFFFTLSSNTPPLHGIFTDNEDRLKKR